MNADAVVQVMESITDLTLRISMVWALIAVSIFFFVGAIVGFDDWRERKREAARYRR